MLAGLMILLVDTYGAGSDVEGLWLPPHRMHHGDTLQAMLFLCLFRSTCLALTVRVYARVWLGHTMSI